MRNTLLALFDFLLNFDYLNREYNEKSWLVNYFANKWSNHPLKIIKNNNVWLRLDGNCITVLGNVIKLRRSYIKSWEYDCTDIYELRKKWWFEKYKPEPGHVILDIGAGMGEDTLLFSRAVEKDGLVISVEAHPKTFYALQVACIYSKSNNVIPRNFAALQLHQEVQISNLSASDWQKNFIEKINENTTQEKSRIIIEGFPLDSCPLIKRLNKINFMKMNIEGAEIDALSGAVNTLQKTENVCICCHDFLGPETATKEKVITILKNHGFDLSFSDLSSSPWEKDFVYGTRALN